MALSVFSRRLFLHGVGAGSVKSQVVTIATATKPLLRSKKRGRRSGILTKKPPRKTRAEQIEELKKQLNGDDEQEEEVSIEIAGTAPITVLEGPPPSMDRDEWHMELGKLWEGVVMDAERSMSLEGKMSLKEDLLRVQQGGMSMKETRFVIRQCLKKITDPTDKKRIETAINPRTDEAFLQYTLTHLITQDALKLITEAISKPPLEDFASLHDRIDELWLDAIPPYRKRAYLETEADLFFKAKRNLYLERWRGASMEPTIAGGSGWTIQSPITKENVHETAVGNVVFCVIGRKNCPPLLVIKRVRALAGDVVDFKGKRMVVPNSHIWIVGDNEAESFDSRHFGAVPMSCLRSRSHVSLSWSPPFITFLS